MWKFSATQKQHDLRNLKKTPETSYNKRKILNSITLNFKKVKVFSIKRQPKKIISKKLLREDKIKFLVRISFHELVDKLVPMCISLAA